MSWLFKFTENVEHKENDRSLEKIVDLHACKILFAEASAQRSKNLIKYPHFFPNQRDSNVIGASLVKIENNSLWHSFRYTFLLKKFSSVSTQSVSLSDSHRHTASRFSSVQTGLQETSGDAHRSRRSHRSRSQRAQRSNRSLFRISMVSGKWNPNTRTQKKEEDEMVSSSSSLLIIQLSYE